MRLGGASVQHEPVALLPVQFCRARGASLVAAAHPPAAARRPAAPPDAAQPAAAAPDAVHRPGRRRRLCGRRDPLLESGRARARRAERIVHRLAGGPVRQRRHLLPGRRRAARPRSTRDQPLRVHAARQLEECFTRALCSDQRRVRLGGDAPCRDARWLRDGAELRAMRQRRELLRRGLCVLRYDRLRTERLPGGHARGAPRRVRLPTDEPSVCTARRRDGHDDRLRSRHGAVGRVHRAPHRTRLRVLQAPLARGLRRPGRLERRRRRRDAYLHRHRQRLGDRLAHRPADAHERAGEQGRPILLPLAVRVH